MANSVYKYPLEIADTQEVVLPKGAEILTAQMQNNNLCLWVVVDTEERAEMVLKVHIVGTGQPAKFRNIDPTVKREPGQQSTYLATVQQGASVWHVFIQL